MGLYPVLRGRSDLSPPGHEGPDLNAAQRLPPGFGLGYSGPWAVFAAFPPLAKTETGGAQHQTVIPDGEKGETQRAF